MAHREDANLGSGAQFSRNGSGYTLERAKFEYLVLTCWCLFQLGWCQDTA